MRRATYIDETRVTHLMHLSGFSTRCGIVVKGWLNRRQLYLTPQSPTCMACIGEEGK